MKDSMTSSKVTTNSNTILEISVQDLKTKLQTEEKFFLIDVREDHEWQRGRIPKAVHIRTSEVEENIEKVIQDKSATIILYCGAGYRSALAASLVGKMGYEHVYNLQGGYSSWFQANFPIDF